LSFLLKTPAPDCKAVGRTAMSVGTDARLFGNAIARVADSRHAAPKIHARDDHRVIDDHATRYRADKEHGNDL
jgi:hypothetical protein